MASTFSPNLSIELIGTGDQAGTWGTTTNSNLGTLIEQAISGYVTQAVATGTDTTITIPNGSTGVARNMYIELTGTGGASTNLIVPANKKLYFIFNNSTGAVTVKVSGQTGVSVPTGKKMVLVSNGTDIVNGLNYIADFASNSATITHLSATSATITNLTLTSLVISNLSIASANITTLTGSTQTLSGNLTLSGGTANGVLYLNGSKVATSGAALVFDGTNLGVGAASGTSSGYATAPQLLNYSASATNLLNASDTSSIIRSAAYRDTTGGGIISMAKFRGTYASPTVVQSGDTSGRLFFDVWGGSNLRRIAEVGALVDTYTSDTNISGTLYFATSTSGNSSSTEKMRLTAAGDLGIGTASPAAKLDVTGFARTTTGAVFQGASNLASGAGLEVGYNTGSSYSFLQSYDRTGSAYRAIRLVGSTIDFDIANSVKATIDSSGNLGIGTASPAAKLETYNSAVNAAFVPNTASTWRVAQIRNDGTGTAGSAAGIAFVGRTDVQPAGIAAIQSTTGGGNTSLSFMYVGSNTTTEGMRLDNSGNLGLGVTPSAWSLLTGLQVKNASLAGYLNNSYLFANSYYDGSSNKYIANGFASYYEQSSGRHLWYQAASGTAGNAISFTQAMTLDASGNLGIGTTSPWSQVSIGTPAGGSTGYFGVKDTVHGGDIRFGKASGVNNNGIAGTFSNNDFLFYTNSTERARITSGGVYLVGTTNTAGSAGVGIKLHPDGLVSTVSTTSISDSYNYYNETAGAYRFYVTNGGTVFATNTTISAISDQRLKENIRDLDAGLDAVMALKPRKFDWKAGKGKDKKDDRGFIAQEFEQVFPDLIDTWKDPAPEGEEPYKSVRQDLIPVLVKAMQEQQAMINELKAKVTALESK